MKILLGKFQVALRKCKGNTRSLNEAQLSHEGAEEKLIHHHQVDPFSYNTWSVS